MKGLTTTARAATAALLLQLGAAWAQPGAAPAPTSAVPARSAEAADFQRRDADWRNGAIVYQVLIDRFAPAADLAAKRHLYPAPKVLHGWDEPARPGRYLDALRLNSQELDFWGGDLASLAGRLDHVRALGADVLYLNPIHLAYTNHKYDALDFQQVSPEFGTRDDFRRLATQAHSLGLKVVLDGVFNHMGRNAPIFQQALADPASPYRHWFAIGPQYAGGYRSWSGYQNLPELNLEHPPVREHLWAGRDSVLRSWLRDGADGWRLDTSYELGTAYLQDLGRAAQAEKPGALIVGEMVNYPGAWMQSIDAVMNFSLRHIILGTAEGQISPAAANRMTARLVHDAGIEPLLKSWVVIDNHDIPRIATLLPDAAVRRWVQALQFTLPGAPNIYYGAELGMTGGTDPQNRGPMRWDLVRDDNPSLQWMRQLITLRKQHRALRVGNYRAVEAERLLAFERHTDRALETVVVLANPSAVPVTERVMVANPWLMDDMPMIDLLRPETGSNTLQTAPRFGAGFMTVTVPAHGVLVLQPRRPDLGGYDRFKRVP
jgi:glycosidase